MKNFKTITSLTAFAAIGLLALSCATDTLPPPGPQAAGAAGFAQKSGALTAAQCSFFAAGDKVTICHHTGSAKKPYTVIRTNVASCGGHSAHEGDYVAVGDPTCNGQGCFPVGAPFDGTVECCEGLAPVDGYCAVVSCPGHASGAPSCGCDAGFSGALAWSFASASWTGACADVDECAAGTSGCAAGTTCANNEGSFSCTANDLVSEYQQYQDATVEEEGEADEEPEGDF